MMSVIVSISDKPKNDIENNEHTINNEQSEYGIWDYYDSSKIMGLPTVLYVCSECFGIIEIIPTKDLLTDKLIMPKYCPCCGIQMKN